MISSQLPVQRDVVLGVVGDADDDAVAFPGDELGAGELPVHRDDALGGAQPSHVGHCHLHQCPGRVHHHIDDGQGRLKGDVLASLLLPPSQVISRFEFSRFIEFTMYLYIYNI